MKAKISSLLCPFRMDKRLKLENKPLYLSLLVVFISSYSVRFLDVSFLSAHITNFSITGSMLVITLYSDLRKGTTYKSFYGALLFWVTVNLILELFIQLGDMQLPGVTFENFNTPDPIDALFGCVAVLIFAWSVKRYCVIKD